MKTYLLNTFNKYKRYSDKLDAKTILCNRCWWVFNDSGQKESYIFREDGSILITRSGAVTYGKWEYITANQSIIITGNDQSFMFHPTFVDGVILALQVDGTLNFAFLIDEQNKAEFKPTTYKEVLGYFEKKERKALAEEKITKNAIIETAKLNEEKKKKQEAEKEIYFKAYWLIQNWRYNLFFYVGITSAIAFTIVCLVFIKCFEQYGLGFILGTIVALTTFHITKDHWMLKIQEKTEKYIQEHPDDPMNPYLKKYLK